MANLTLVIDEEVLKRARIRALHEGTSVNAVVREQLERYAGARETDEGMERFLRVARASTAASAPGGRGWTRDELYER